MAMTRSRKLCVGLALFLILFFFVLPAALGVALRGTVEEKLHAALNAPVKLGGLSVSLFPPGATLRGLEVGEPSALAGGAPLAKSASLSASVTWDTVFGGAPHVTHLGLDGVEIHLGVDEKGRSTLGDFLAQLPPSASHQPLWLDSLRLDDVRLILHVPKRILAPDSALEPDPVTVEWARLKAASLILPAPGEAPPKELWSSFDLAGVKVRAPFKGQAPVPEPEGAAPALEEGVTLERCSGAFQIPASLTAPLQARNAKVEGLRVRNIFRMTKDPETLARVQTALAVCLRVPRAKTAGKARQFGNGGLFVNDLALSGSALEVQGPDGLGQPAFWRLADLKLDAEKLCLGPGTAALAGGPGHLRLSSPTLSSEGPGKFEWTCENLTGSWPKPDFDSKLALDHAAATPFDRRIKRSAGEDMRVEKGHLAIQLDGPARGGKLKLAGSLTLSDNFKLGGDGLAGGVLVASSAIVGSTAGKTFPVRVGGTVLDPTPDITGIPKALVDLGVKALFGEEACAWSMFTTGVGGLFGDGAKQADKVLQSLPGFGGLFGSSQEKKPAPEKKGTPDTGARESE